MKPALSVSPQTERPHHPIAAGLRMRQTAPLWGTSIRNPIAAALDSDTVGNKMTHFSPRFSNKQNSSAGHPCGQAMSRLPRLPVLYHGLLNPNYNPGRLIYSGCITVGDRKARFGWPPFPRGFRRCGEADIGLITSFAREETINNKVLSVKIYSLRHRAKEK